MGGAIGLLRWGMTEAVDPLRPPARTAWSIVHPTDFSRGSQRAFAHALRIALGQVADGAPADAPEQLPPAEARLTLVHVGKRSEAHWTDYPGIRDTLARWGLISPRATRERVGKLGIRASKIHLDGEDPVKGVLQRASKVHADLLVAATHRRGAFGRWLKPSMAEAIARSSEACTLLIPPKARGFVDRRSGRVALRQVLLPVVSDPRPDRAIEETISLLERLGCTDARLRFLSVGEDVDVDVPAGWATESIRRDGDVVGSILKDARDADLVVMTSLGHDSAVDRVLGSTTERVLHGLTVPLLVVPGVR